jgi:hypothetical protein
MYLLWDVCILFGYMWDIQLMGVVRPLQSTRSIAGAVVRMQRIRDRRKRSA